MQKILDVMMLRKNDWKLPQIERSISNTVVPGDLTNNVAMLQIVSYDSVCV